MTVTTPLFALPDELLLEVLTLLPFYDLVSSLATSRRLHAIASNDLLWRALCRSGYRYWNPAHDIYTRLRLPASSTPWRQVMSGRARTDARVAGLFESLLASQVDRIAKVSAIAQLGYDAKDYLLDQVRCPDHAQDVLARRYYATEILGSIERIVALDEMAKLCQDSEYPIERALGILDLLVCENVPYGLDDISARLDIITKGFEQAHPDYAQQTTRQTALDLVAYLRQESLTVIPTTEASFSKIKARLIGITLLDADHSSLPLVSGAIYCACAQRLGINARINNFPRHVYVTVVSEEAADLNGQSPGSSSTLFLNPGAESGQVSVRTLQTQLSLMGEIPERFQDYVRPADLVTLMVRMCNNLLNVRRPDDAGYEPALDLLAPSPPSPDAHLIRQREMPPVELNMARIFYSVAWLYLVAFVHVRERLPEVFMDHRFYITRFCACLTDYPQDAWLVEERLNPRVARIQEGDIVRSIRSLIEELREQDHTPRPIKRRPRLQPRDAVRYRVGDVFRHRRFQYTAVIRGWDPRCAQEEEWIETMGVDRLPNGRNQSFYNAVADREYYVAEENIQVLNGSDGMGLAGWRPDKLMLKQAGKFFKRFDEHEGRFVSNLVDEYPDD